MEKQLGWTTIKQSEKLIKAGLNPNTADMFYLYDWNNHKHNNTPDTLIIYNWEDPYNKSIPCWSLGALINLMPFKPTINGIKVFFQLNQLGCRYVYRDDDTSIKEVVVFTDGTLIDNVVSMVCWLLESNYIKKEEAK